MYYTRFSFRKNERMFPFCIFYEDNYDIVLLCTIVTQCFKTIFIMRKSFITFDRNKKNRYNPAFCNIASEITSEQGKVCQLSSSCNNEIIRVRRCNRFFEQATIRARMTRFVEAIHRTWLMRCNIEGKRIKYSSSFSYFLFLF